MHPKQFEFPSVLTCKLEAHDLARFLEIARNIGLTPSYLCRNVILNFCNKPHFSDASKPGISRRTDKGPLDAVAEPAKGTIITGGN